MDLAGSLAVVTGATEGIGRAIAMTLGSAGARVAICPGSVATPFMDKQDRLRPNRERVLTADDVAHAVLATVTIADRAMVSELDIRPTNP